jgi:hypothetical protein
VWPGLNSGLLVYEPLMSICSSNGTVMALYRRACKSFGLHETDSVSGAISVSHLKLVLSKGPCGQSFQGVKLPHISNISMKLSVILSLVQPIMEYLW